MSNYSLSFASEVSADSKSFFSEMIWASCFLMVFSCVTSILCILLILTFDFFICRLRLSNIPIDFHFESPKVLPRSILAFLDLVLSTKDDVESIGVGD